jgi:hypothetical protein
MKGPNGKGRTPTWMKAVSKETLYDAEPADASEEGAPAKASASSSPNDAEIGSSSHDDSSSLSQELALSMADPSDIPRPDPDLQPTPVGHVRADLDKQLEKAVSVLASRYDTDLSRSLILEFALRRTIVQLREQGDESPLVQWLDSLLPRF